MSGSDDDEIEQEVYLTKKVAERKAEIRALKRELKHLNTAGGDLRELFAAERTRYGGIPTYWVLLMVLHMVSALNAWHQFRLQNHTTQSVLCIVHQGMFLLYWRRFYYPEKKFVLPMSIWILIVSYYWG